MIAAEPRSESTRVRVRHSHATAALAVRLGALALLLAGVASLGSGAGDQDTPVDFTVAFIGDQGLGSDAEAVLGLIRSEGADAVVHSGDFDYQDDPAAWDDQIDRILGPDFPYFASAGNHDTSRFYAPGGYQQLLAARMNRLGVAWSGDLGVQSSHRYQGIFFVLTAADVFGGGDGFHDLYIHDELAADDSIWSISSWHKNMRLMQVGGKSDDTGWGVYEESRRGGAIIATAHEHSYSRTHLLSSLEQQIVASTENTLVLERDDPGTPGDEGRSFAFVSGLGGQSIRDQELSGPWWASIYTSTQGANHGALFGVFNFGGDPRLAHFYFKDIDGVVADEFFVRSTLGSSEPVIVLNDVSVAEGNAGTTAAVFTASLLFGGSEEARVDYATADGSARASEDYQSTSGTLTLSAAQPTRTLTVLVNGDAADESDESFFVNLANPVNAALPYPGGVGTIVDDDAGAQFSVAVKVDGSGTVSLDPPGGTYDADTVVTLTAAPLSGHVFTGWSGDLTGMENPAMLTLDADKSVTATFTAAVQLVVKIRGSGRVALDPPGGSYPPGTLVTLTAIADPGFRFSGWSGDLGGSTNPAVLRMDANKTVRASFRRGG